MGQLDSVVGALILTLITRTNNIVQYQLILYLIPLPFYLYMNHMILLCTRYNCYNQYLLHRNNIVLFDTDWCIVISLQSLLLVCAYRHCSLHRFNTMLTVIVCCIGITLYSLSQSIAQEKHYSFAGTELVFAYTNYLFLLYQKILKF